MDTTSFDELVGLITGSYSSIFVAAPLVAIAKEREPRYRGLRKQHATAGVLLVAEVDQLYLQHFFDSCASAFPAWKQRALRCHFLYRLA